MSAWTKNKERKDLYMKETEFKGCQLYWAYQSACDAYQHFIGSTNPPSRGKKCEEWEATREKLSDAMMDAAAAWEEYKLSMREAS